MGISANNVWKISKDINLNSKLLINCCFFRSSLSWKHHIDVGAGVVDRDYRGNVGVVLFNLSKTDYTVHQGDRIAQLIVERISTPSLVEVEVKFMSLGTYLLQCGRHRSNFPPET